MTGESLAASPIKLIIRLNVHKREDSARAPSVAVVDATTNDAPNNAGAEANSRAKVKPIC